MARLHEYQGKRLLQERGFAVPRGGPATTPAEARRIAEEIGGPVMVKAQVWMTRRAGLGGIRRAETPAEAEAVARTILGLRLGPCPVDTVLVEECLESQREFYASIVVDDRALAPLLTFSSRGGPDIEEIVREDPAAVASMHVDVEHGLRDYQARNLVRRTGIHGQLQMQLGEALLRLYDVARACEARAVEVNPLVAVANGRIYAADCRITVDDDAVLRHPDLGITFARELDRPPTTLERIAYAVEESDGRGTFYFIQMAEGFHQGDGYVGFHGADGGGALMSMDAAQHRGFHLANFADTRGDLPASKVYRAARIILSQPGLDGYFGSGAGFARQEQFHAARGLVKALLEEHVDIPVVIRLGGHAGDQAVEILERLNGLVPAPVEGYRQDDSADFCADRLAALVRSGERRAVPPPAPRPAPQEPYSFQTITCGTVTFDHAVCRTCESKVCVADCVPQILKLADGVPVLSIPPEEAQRGGCSECLACEVECRFRGAGGGHVHLPIPGLDEYRAKVRLK